VSVPTKGLSLPLISAGGSGLVITCAALGLLLSITKFKHSQDELAEVYVREVEEPEALTPFDLIRPEGRITDPSLG